MLLRILFCLLSILMILATAKKKSGREATVYFEILQGGLTKRE
jgi:hypothetical protein